LGLGDDWQIRSLGDLAVLHQEQVNPGDHPDQMFRHFSLPAFDAGQVPVHERGSSIGSHKFTVPSGAILVSKLNPRIPRVWEPDTESDVPAVASTEFLVLLPRAGVDRRFLKYACLAPPFRLELESRTTGTSGSHQRVRPDDALTIGLRAPEDPQQQRAVGHILGILDDKIGLNRRMNETLALICRAIFKSWFVDFDPVRARMEGDSAHGMSAQTAALFPSRLTGSAMGLIPDSWAASYLADLCEVQIGGDWGQDEPFEGSIAAASFRGIDLANLRSTGYSKAPKRWLSFESFSKRSVDETDILIAASGAGPLGRPLWMNSAISRLYDCPVTYSNFCKRLRAVDRVTAIYIDFLLHELRESGEIWEYASGTSVPNLDTAGFLKSRPIVIPSHDVLNAFASLVEFYYQCLFSGESLVLAELRNVLLPRLVSGEMRLAHAERLIKSTV
jgi:type I restriction enzyme S subunit